MQQSKTIQPILRLFGCNRLIYVFLCYRLLSGSQWKELHVKRSVESKNGNKVRSLLTCQPEHNEMARMCYLTHLNTNEMFEDLRPVKESEYWMIGSS